MGISLRDCAHSDIDVVCDRIYNKITTYAKDLVQVGEEVADDYGIPIINKQHFCHALPLWQMPVRRLIM